MNKKLASFVDFAKDNPQAMSQIQTREAAMLVLSYLIELKLTPQQLVERTYNFSYGDELLGKLAEHYRATEKWWEFVEAVHRLAKNYVNDGIWTRENLSKIISDPATIDYLLVHHRQSLLGFYDHPFTLLSADEYWGWKVRWYIVKKDFRRAWDELRKAYRGFYTGSTPLSTSSYDYQYPANRELIKRLIDELFERMVQNGLLEPLVEVDQKVPEYSQRGTYTVITPKGRVIDKQYSVDQSTAWEMAREFQVNKRTQMWGTPYIFEETGAKIHKIDAHYRKLRDADRRRRVISKLDK